MIFLNLVLFWLCILAKCMNGFVIDFKENALVTIKVSDSPIMMGNLTIPFDKTLVIEPGVEIQLEPSARITVYGSLIANGTDAEKIIFKTNSKAYWDSIWILNDIEMKTNNKSSLSYVNLENCGSSGNAAVYINANNFPFLENVIINKSSSYGISLYYNNTEDLILRDFKITKTKQNAIKIHSYKSNKIELSNIAISESNGILIASNHLINEINIKNVEMHHVNKVLSLQPEYYASLNLNTIDSIFSNCNDFYSSYATFFNSTVFQNVTFEKFHDLFPRSLHVEFSNVLMRSCNLRIETGFLSVKYTDFNDTNCNFNVRKLDIKNNTFYNSVFGFQCSQKFFINSNNDINILKNEKTVLFDSNYFELGSIDFYCRNVKNFIFKNNTLSKMRSYKSLFNQDPETFDLDEIIYDRNFTLVNNIFIDNSMDYIAFEIYSIHQDISNNQFINNTFSSAFSLSESDMFNFENNQFISNRFKNSYLVRFIQESNSYSSFNNNHFIDNTPINSQVSSSILLVAIKNYKFDAYLSNNIFSNQNETSNREIEIQVFSRLFQELIIPTNSWLLSSESQITETISVKNKVFDIEAIPTKLLNGSIKFSFPLVDNKTLQGFLTRDLYLSKENGPYLLNNNTLIITENVTLTVEAGTKFQLSGLVNIYAFGKIIIKGSENKRVIIRSSSDSNVTILVYNKVHKEHKSLFSHVDFDGMISILVDGFMPVFEKVVMKNNFNSPITILRSFDDIKLSSISFHNISESAVSIAQSVSSNLKIDSVDFGKIDSSFTNGNFQNSIKPWESDEILMNENEVLHYQNDYSSTNYENNLHTSFSKILFKAQENQVIEVSTYEYYYNFSTLFFNDGDVLSYYNYFTGERVFVSSNNSLKIDFLLLKNLFLFYFYESYSFWTIRAIDRIFKINDFSVEHKHPLFASEIADRSTLSSTSLTLASSHFVNSTNEFIDEIETISLDNPSNICGIFFEVFNRLYPNVRFQVILSDSNDQIVILNEWISSDRSYNLDLSEYSKKLNYKLKFKLISTTKNKTINLSNIRLLPCPKKVNIEIINSNITSCALYEQYNCNNHYSIRFDNNVVSNIKKSYYNLLLSLHIQRISELSFTNNLIFNVGETRNYGQDLIHSSNLIENVDLINNTIINSAFNRFYETYNTNSLNVKGNLILNNRFNSFLHVHYGNNRVAIVSNLFSNNKYFDVNNNNRLFYIYNYNYNSPFKIDENLFNSNSFPSLIDFTNLYNHNIISINENGFIRNSIDKAVTCDNINNNCIFNNYSFIANWWGQSEDAATHYGLPQSTILSTIPESLKKFNIENTFCDKGWTQIESSCFIVLNTKLPYHHAASICSSVFAESKLISEITPQINQAFKNLTTNAWLPISAVSKCRSFNFLSGSTNEDIACNELNSVICEKSQCRNSFCKNAKACIGTRCICEDGWFGENCDEFNCDQMNKCSGHGKCVGPNECKCDANWLGSSCGSSNCPTFSWSCMSCTSQQHCGWCDETKTCLPADKSGAVDAAFSCPKWFYYNCMTRQDGGCSAHIEQDDCLNKFCEANSTQYNKGKCRICKDFNSCFRNEDSCAVWNETKCPNGKTTGDYLDPNRYLDAEINPKVVMVDSITNETVYKCAVDSASFEVLIINDSKLKEAVYLDSILISENSGGIFHKVQRFVPFGDYIIALAHQADPNEMYSYADFKTPVRNIQIEDHSLLVDNKPSSRVIEALKNEWNASKVTNLGSEQVFKCLGNKYEFIEKERLTRGSTVFIAALKNSLTANLAVSDVIYSNEQTSYLEIIDSVDYQQKDAQKLGFVKSHLAECSKINEISSRILLKNADNSELSCFGGKKSSSSSLYVLKETQDLKAGDLIKGRQSNGFIMQIVSIKEAGDFRLFECKEIRSMVSPIELELNENKFEIEMKDSKEFLIPKLSTKFSNGKGLSFDFDSKFESSTMVHFTPEVTIEFGFTLTHKLDVSIENAHSESAQNKFTELSLTFLAPIGPVSIPSRITLQLRPDASLSEKTSINSRVTFEGISRYLASFSKSFTKASKLSSTFSINRKSDDLEQSKDVENSQAAAGVVLTCSLTLPSFPSLPFKKKIPDFIQAKISEDLNQSLFEFRLLFSIPYLAELNFMKCSEGCFKKDKLKTFETQYAIGQQKCYLRASMQTQSFKKDYKMELGDTNMLKSEFCTSEPKPCCQCEDGSNGLIDAKTQKCKCACECQNGEKSFKDTDTGECICEICPNGSFKQKMADGSFGCPCKCLDGSVREQKKDGSCNCDCKCPDMSYDTIDKNGTCACECQCKDCTVSKKTPSGCYCPNDNKKCEDSNEVGEWMNCKFECKGKYPCGKSPFCFGGRTGPKCETPVCGKCGTTCSGNGRCIASYNQWNWWSNSQTCKSYCACYSGWDGECCEIRSQQVWGDPWFRNDRLVYAFQGLGEYWYCQDQLNDLGVQIRFFVRSLRASVSFISGVAVKLRRSIFTVFVNAEYKLSLRLNNTILERKDKKIILEEGDEVINMEFSKSMITIDRKGHSIITIFVQYSFLNMNFGLLKSMNTKGLCAPSTSNQFKGPNGDNYSDVWKFAKSWQISSSNTDSNNWSWTRSNFHADDILDKYHDEANLIVSTYYNSIISAPQARSVRSVSTAEDKVLEEKARDTCLKNGLKDEMLFTCMTDIIATRDLQLGENEIYKLEKCPNQCNNHGKCIGENLCECLPGWSGSDCSIGECSVKCTPNGKCFNGFCVCESGWEGADCKTKADCTLRNDCTNKNQGTCDKTNQCVCKIGFKGENCSEVSTCDSLNKCNRNGFCIDDKCICNSGWTSEDCSKASCYEMNYCSEHGKCIGFNLCECDAGWNDVRCATPMCTQLNNCSRNGLCVSPDKCQCNSGYTGSDCSQKIACVQLNDCNRNGVCENADKCICFTGYEGVSCDRVACDKVNNCNGNGQCVQPNLCKCKQGFGGVDCSKRTCEELNYCTLNGNCDENSKCVCNQGWYGDDCSMADCSAVNGCSENGACIAPNKCECFEGFDGEKCDNEAEENIYSPEFEKESYTFEINESISVGELLFKLRCTDKDKQGRNSFIQYFIEKIGDFKFFSIKRDLDNSDALIYLKESLFDVEKSVFTINVTAYDNGVPKKYATTSISINVKRLLSCSDMFINTFSTISLKKTDLSLNTIQSINLKPSDLKRDVEYSLLQISDYLKSFIKLDKSGLLSIDLDVSIGFYSLQIIAKQSEGDQLCEKQYSIELSIFQDLPREETTSTSSSTTPTSTPRPTSNQVSQSDPSNDKTTISNKEKTPIKGKTDYVPLILGIVIPIAVVVIFVIVIVSFCYFRKKTRLIKKKDLYAITKDLNDEK